MQKIQSLIVAAIPLTTYLEQATLLLSTKGLERIENPIKIVTFAYYIYIFSVYSIQILRTIFTRLLKGYSRGKWIQIASTVQIIIQLVLIITAVVLINRQQGGGYWVIWELLLFSCFFAFMVIVRGSFLILVYIKVLGSTQGDLQLKQSFWLMMTTPKELYESGGHLTYEPQAKEVEIQLKTS